MKNNIEELLQQALSADAEPSPWLNQKILQTVKEKQQMKRFTKKSFGAAAIAATLILCSLGAFAGWKYLTPAEVAKSFTDFQLSKAFEAEDAMIINETQEFDDYTITLLGITSGENLSSDTELDENGQLDNDKTYIVTAIENADGTPRPDVSEEAYGTDPFYISPYVQGLSITQHNAHTFGGGYHEDVIDGIQYRLLECDNIEMFAYQTIYLGVSEGTFCDAQAFIMDEVTGELTRNEAYEGVNALFTLPIPAFKGDEAAVDAYLNKKDQESSKDIFDAEESELSFDTLQEALEDWTIDDFEANAVNIYSEELTPDQDGFISYTYASEAHSADGTILLESLFPEMQSGLSKNMFISTASETWESYHVETYELLENGNVMLRVYFYEASQSDLP